ncbi:DNA gyrase inhibitor YacG [Marinobacterium jannaschii]|uniref:DNA gyrase inhibitor YacG n=1 Tax=Marinobacterium jannaschii TaxID=64970 RepID=UPI00048940DB|nr:DNA gyrase inhibitor YacG [Marinobacterium jannaschii]
MSKVKLNCPQCGKKMEWNSNSPFRPFCSERCKQIDLGAWANEEYQINTPADANDFSSGDDLSEQEFTPTTH